MLLTLAQFALVVAGIIFLCRRGILLWDFLLPRPWTVYVGLILIIQLPITVLGAFAFGAAEGVKSARANAPPNMKKLEEKATYLNLGIVAVAVVGAAVTAAVGVRRDEAVFSMPEEVVGVRDYAAEQERDANEEMVDRVRASRGL